MITLYLRNQGADYVRAARRCTDSVIFRGDVLTLEHLMCRVITWPKRSYSQGLLLLTVATAIKQELPAILTPGQILPGVLSAPTPNGWFAHLNCKVNVLVPRPLGSNGPVLGDPVMVKIIAINRESGSVVGSLIDGKSVSSFR